MALNIVVSNSEQLVSAELCAYLRGGLSRSGSAVLLVPNFAAQLEASRGLAEAGLSLGVTVATPSSWAGERWEVWGDGTHIVTPGIRSIVMSQMLGEAANQGRIANNSGTLHVLERLARSGATLAGTAEAARGSVAFTPAERVAIELVGAYSDRLRSRGFVEGSEAMERIPGLLARQEVAVGPVALVGFDQLTYGERELVRGLSSITSVWIVLRPGNLSAMAPLEQSLELLGAGAGPSVSGFTSAGRTPELAAVLNGLFGAQGAGVALNGTAAPADTTAAPSGTAAPTDTAAAPGGTFAPEGPVPVEGSLGIVLPSGPAAEAEAVAQAIEKLAHNLDAQSATLRGGEGGDGGSSVGVSSDAQPTPSREGTSKGRSSRDGAAGERHTIVVSSPNVERAWRELAPKLAVRGFTVRSSVALKVTRTEPGRAFVEFASAVAKLRELEQAWPPREETPEGVVVPLGNMGWWPPEGLVDFLMSDLSGMDAGKVMDLDRSWRQNRLLTPSDVLAGLQNQKTTSPQVADATRELLRGRIGTAASKLLRGLVLSQDDDRPQAQQNDARSAFQLAVAQGVLAKVLDVAADLKRVGISADASLEGAVSLTALVQTVIRVLDEATIVVRPQLEATRGVASEWGAEGASSFSSVRSLGDVPWLVEILAPREVARLPRCGVDALVLCGQTSESSPVGNGDDVASSLLVALGIEPKVEPMDQARQQFVAQLAAARYRVLIERTLFDASSKECYCSVMLIELMSCYGIDDTGLKVSKIAKTLKSHGLLFGELSESDAFANAQLTGHEPAVEAQEVPSRSGVLREDLLPFVVVAPAGQRGLSHALPLLSASQIEAYLECPLKWFSLRRLRLEVSDAGFTGAEIGTFVHKVLEATHRELVRRAREQAQGEPVSTGQAGGDSALVDLTLPLPGSRPVAGDAASVAGAKELLQQTFEAERRHQFVQQKKLRGATPLIPHTAEDEGTLRTLQQDLLSTIDYESGLFLGYEPRLFEWKFGRGGEVVEYAGVQLEGSIDRVDVDGGGRAVVIDYKHKSPIGFAQEYNVFGPEGIVVPDIGPIPLARHVQALIYAQVLRRKYPDLTVTGSVYLCTKGQHALAGAVSEDSIDRVYGEQGISPKMRPSVAVPTGERERLLDATEEAIAAKVQELLAGNIEANPVDARACDYCPVLDCEKRLSK